MNTSKKAGRYQRIYEQLKDLLVKTNSPIARMATINAVLHHKMDGFFWTGFYLFTDGKLLVGPYQGSLACQELQKDNGVCWACFNALQPVIVPNVHEFPGHIACDSRSNSEICIPVFDTENKIVAILDIDSALFENFDDTDARELSRIAALIYA